MDDLCLPQSSRSIAQANQKGRNQRESHCFHLRLTSNIANGNLQSDINKKSPAAISVISTEAASCFTLLMTICISGTVVRILRGVGGFELCPG